MDNKLPTSRGQKMVDCYRLLEKVDSYPQCKTCLILDELYRATHADNGQQYLLKKIPLEGEIYEVFLNEATILRTLQHPNIVKCRKMLKASNNIYLVYDYLQGLPLDEFLQLRGSRFTFSEREKIARQICSAVAEIGINSIGHLNLCPDSIVIVSPMKVILRDFVYAVRLPEEGLLDIKNLPPNSEYVAPQVLKGVAYSESDVYSVGKLSLLLFQQTMELNPQENAKVLHLREIFMSATKRNPKDRITIEEVCQVLKDKGIYSQRITRRSSQILEMSKSILSSKSLKRSSMGASLVQKSKETASMCQEMKSTSTIGSSNCQRYPRDSLIDFSPEGTHTTKPSCPIVLKILKHRNVAHFLLYMLKSVTQIGSKAGDVTIVLYVILLKRAIVELTNIGKYLHYGVEDGRLGLTQSPKVYARFKKTSDCMHLTKIITRQIAMTKKEFDNIIETVYIDHIALLKNQKFNVELKVDSVDQAYLRQCVKEYLKSINNQIGRIESLATSQLTDLYLLSCLAQSVTVYELFQDELWQVRASQNFSLQQQFFIRKAKTMTRPQLTLAINNNINGFYNVSPNKLC